MGEVECDVRGGGAALVEQRLEEARGVGGKLRTVWLRWGGGRQLALKDEKSAPGGASACTSQPWLKPSLACVKRMGCLCASGSRAKPGSASGAMAP